MQEIMEFILSSMIMVITPIIFGVLTLDESIRKDKSKVVVVFMIVFLSSLIIYRYFDGIIKTFASFLLHAFLYKNFFNISLKKSIFVSFIYMIVLMIPDICILLLSNLIGISKEFFYNIFAGSLIGNIFVSIIITLIIIIFNKVLKRINNSELEKSDNVIFLAIFAIFSIIILFFDIIYNYKNDNGISSYVLIIVIFLLVIGS